MYFPLVCEGRSGPGSSECRSVKLSQEDQFRPSWRCSASSSKRFSSSAHKLESLACLASREAEGQRSAWSLLVPSMVKGAADTNRVKIPWWWTLWLTAHHSVAPPDAPSRSASCDRSRCGDWDGHLECGRVMGCVPIQSLRACKQQSEVADVAALREVCPNSLNMEA